MNQYRYINMYLARPRSDLPYDIGIYRYIYAGSWALVCDGYVRYYKSLKNRTCFQGGVVWRSHEMLI